MRKRILSGLILAVILAIVSLGVSSIRGEMNWNHLIGSLIGGIIAGSLVVPFLQNKFRKKDDK